MELRLVPWGIIFSPNFIDDNIEYKGFMCETLLNLQKKIVSGQNICIESMGTHLVPSPMYDIVLIPRFLLQCSS